MQHSPSLPQILAGTYSFPCSHQIHQPCLVRWTDMVHTEQPTEKTVNCPVCRHVTTIPTKHSAEQISNWEKISQRLMLVIGTILGVGIGVAISRSSSAEEISKTALTKFYIPPTLAFALAGGLLGFIGSYCLIPSGGPISRLTKAITSLYNWIYGTEIKSSDIWMYRSGFSSAPKPMQLQLTQEYLMNVEIGTLSEQIKLTPFNSEERTAIQSHISLLANFEASGQLLSNSFFEMLERDHGDLYAQVKRVNSQLLQSTGNGALKEQLGSMIKGWLCQRLARMDTTTNLDSNMAARVALIQTLEDFKEKKQFSEARKAEQWSAFLSLLQEECHQPTSSLINDLKTKMGPDFFKKPLALLLWDEVVIDDVFDALNQIRKDQFKQAGFGLRS